MSWTKTLPWLPGSIVAAGCALLGACGPSEEPPREPTFIVTDGRFDDWRGIEPTASAAAAMPTESAVDLGTVRVADDPAFLHLAIEVGRPANAQAMAGTVLLAFDDDADEATGGEAAGMKGVDVVAELSVREESSAVGAGTGVRLVGPEGIGRVRPSYDLGLLVSPTHAASQWEVRLARGTAFGGRRLFATETLRLTIAFLDDQGLREQTGPASYVFTTQTGPAVGAPGQRLAASPGTVRVVSWNVGGGRMRDHPEPFARMLAVLRPDVILFDELFEEVSLASLEAFVEKPSLAEIGPYEVALGASGGRQRSAVVSRIGLVAESRLMDVRYGEKGLAELARGVADPSFDALAEAEKQRGLSIAGAWVGSEDRRLLVVAVDLQSGGSAGSAFDRLRAHQAEVLADRVRRVAPDALVIGGDLNLVGSDRPLRILQQALGDGDELAVADAYRLTDRSQATWRAIRRSHAFGPGRLDYQLSTPATLAIDRAFVFHPEEVSETARRLHSVRATDADEASQHLPVVVDYRWRTE